MMLFLANAGSSTATAFKFIYLKLTTFKTNYKLRKLKRDKSLSMPFGDNQDYFDNGKGSMLDSTNVSEIIYQNHDEFVYENANYNKSEFLAPNKTMSLQRKTSFNKKMANIDELSNSKLELEVESKKVDSKSKSKVSSSTSKMSKKTSKKKTYTEKKPNSVTIGIRNFEISKELSEKLVNESNEKAPIFTETNKKTTKVDTDAIKRMNELIDTKSQAGETETNYGSKSNLNVNLDSDEENNQYLLGDIFNNRELERKKVSNQLTEDLASKVLDEQSIHEKNTQAPLEDSLNNKNKYDRRISSIDNKKSKTFKGIIRYSKRMISVKNKENFLD